jgi:nucleotide-binding universal stress UspA family protein
MTRKLMIAYDGSDEARDALALGKILADACGAELILVGVVVADFPHGRGSDDVHNREQVLRGQLENATASIDVEPNLRLITSRSAARGLHDVAEREDADILVLGSSHRGGLGRVLAGSVTERVLNGAPCAIAVAPRGFRNQELLEPRVLMVGFDGMPESRDALSFAAGIAETCGATLRVVAVQEPAVVSESSLVPTYDDRGRLVESERDRFQKALDEALDELPRSVRPQGSVLPGAATDVLSEAAETGIDLLVVGSRGYGPVRRVLLGGVSTALVRSAPCPILVVPRAGATTMSADNASQEAAATDESPPGAARASGSTCLATRAM